MQTEATCYVRHAHLPIALTKAFKFEVDQLKQKKKKKTGSKIMSSLNYT